MKKVIDGAVYNTDTAKKIGSIEPAGYNCRDFNYFCETLYKTKAGKYFLHGEGGGNSRYGKWVGNTGGWGETIRPYTLQEAMVWTEKNLDADEYSAEFGEPEEAAEGKVTIGLTLTQEAKYKLEKLRSETGKAISQIISEYAESL
jgi:hypothetical protein